MYIAATEIRFQAKHALRMSPDFTEPMHGHDWRVRASIGAEQLDSNGMVIDFYVLKRLLRQAVSPLEQSESINAMPEFQGLGINPSTEQIARFIYEKLAGQLPAGLSLVEVVVWETAECRGGYSR
jgi:6-pyruvoyltetrahydropterin/6-carboxytetrahydropterin synthase